MNNLIQNIQVRTYQGKLGKTIAALTYFKEAKKGMSIFTKKFEFKPRFDLQSFEVEGTKYSVTYADDREESIRVYLDMYFSVVPLQVNNIKRKSLQLV